MRDISETPWALIERPPTVRWRDARYVPIVRFNINRAKSIFS
jgi:hypothetical protein